VSYVFRDSKITERTGKGKGKNFYNFLKHEGHEEHEKRIKNRYYPANTLGTGAQRKDKFEEKNKRNIESRRCAEAQRNE